MPAPAAKQASGRGRLFRRLVQAASLILFLLLLWREAAFSSGADGAIPPNIFLRLDPLAATVTMLASREWISALWPALGLLGLALITGRLFCGWLCPLGTTLDAAAGLMNRYAGPIRRSAGPSASLRRTKYLLLAAALAAALAGINLAYWAAPIPLATRFYGLVLYPLILLGGHEALNFTRPFLDSLDWPSLSYLAITPKRFASMYFLVGFFGLIIWLERVKPRFWCNYLCPAGALLGLFSRRPWWRRRVSACTSCGKCAPNCPANAGRREGQASPPPGECLTCQTCADICSTGGSAFLLFHDRTEEGAPPASQTTALPDPESRPPLNPGSAAFPSRRAFLGAALGGLGLAGLARSSLASLLRPQTRGTLWSEDCLRPPGARPEPDFLARCLRCGLCLRACPTNGLQPAWLAAGPEGVFSPVLRPRRGPCEPDCNLCGLICPTQAITALDPAEKRWAKIGGAVVHQNRCLAWAEGKSCVVCQEVCPYGAIELAPAASALGPHVPGPVVTAAKCFGCGYCEQHCPVLVSAITIQPLNALRLARGSYIQAGQAAGLDLAKKNEPDPPPPRPEGELPPGFDFE